jgi:predicted nucleotidyltransferase
MLYYQPLRVRCTVTCHERYHAAMKPSEAIAIHREKIRRIIANFGGTNPRIFGSVARGEDTERSDLDLFRTAACSIYSRSEA